MEDASRIYNVKRTVQIQNAKQSKSENSFITY